MFTFLRKILLTALLATLASQASAMFIQPDWFDPTMEGVGTNRYAYSFNDPVNRLDPGGNQSLVDPIPGPVWQDNVVVGGVVIGGSIAYGAIMAGRPGGLIDMPPIYEPPPPEFFENEGFTPSGYSGPGMLSTPSGEFIDIGIVSTPKSGAGGIIVSTPDGQTFKLPNYVESRGNILGPDPNATGPHTTPKYGPDGKITGYQEWNPNPKNPTGFDAGRRVDVSGKPHTNKDGTRVPTPHVHELGEKDVRPAEPDEIPK